MSTDEGVLCVLPDIPDAAPHDVREGIARRRITVVDGQCPCGATFTMPTRAERRVGRLLFVTIEHEDDCPAVGDALMQWAANQ